MSWLVALKTLGRFAGAMIAGVLKLDEEGEVVFTKFAIGCWRWPEWLSRTSRTGLLGVRERQFEFAQSLAKKVWVKSAAPPRP